MNKDIEHFAYTALNKIIYEILNVDILHPSLQFDYSVNLNINNGYYMYQNIRGDMITLNMSNILELQNENDMKTVITYGFIHEIIHMFQRITSSYTKDLYIYTQIEDSADKMTIDIIHEKIQIINEKLNFTFNDVFLKGIERQLGSNINMAISLANNNNHVIRAISGALTNKFNGNYDYIYNLLCHKIALNIIFPRYEYFIDLFNTSGPHLDDLVNCIYMNDFKIVKVVAVCDNVVILKVF